MSETQLSSQIYMKLNGTLAEDDLMGNLVEVAVEQHCHLPDMVALRLHDPLLELVDGSQFDLGDVVEIGSYGEDGRPISLIEGEITALEPNFDASMVAELVVRGYDRSHRLLRDRKCRAFVNVRDSDLAQQIANEAGLEAVIDLTPIIYDHVYQHNQSDLGFLLARAGRIGYECFVEKNTLYFRRPSMSGSSQVTLTWGEDMLAVRPRLTVAEQVSEVMVKGWDFERQQPIVGQAQQSDGRLRPDAPIARNQNGQSNRLLIADRPVVNQQEANLMAAARMDELSGALLEVEGSVFRRPDVKAGRLLTLAGMGERYSGTYLVTAVTHIYTPNDGLEAHFAVRGLRSGSLSELVGRGEPDSRWFGVVPAVVTNNEDPKKLGRVRVKFPWLTDDTESDWARVVTPHAGPLQQPAVDEEVLVAFEHGDFNRPYVLGGMANQKQPLPGSVSSAQIGEVPQIWQSRAGHRISMYDGGQKRLEIETPAGHQVKLDDGQGQLEIRSQGGLIIRLDDRQRRIIVESNGDVAITADGNMSLRANANLNLTANGQVNVKGAIINLN
jgi:phage protein D/phage baseplate assembly protein gpV